MEVGRLITAEEAERRVLILENPGVRGPVSRHQHALRRRADDPAGRDRARRTDTCPRRSASCSTARAPIPRSRARSPYMSPGDFVITAELGAARPRQHLRASRCCGSTCSTSRQVNFFEASFAEQFESATQPTSRQDGDSLAFYGSGVLPDGAPAHLEPQPGDQLHLRAHAPDRRAHDEGGRHRQAPWRARALRQSDQRRPGAADHEREPRDVPGKASRARTTASTDGTIFVCVEGKGTTTVDGKVLEWGPSDVFVVPPWKHYSHQAGEGVGAVLDLRPPAQEALGIWREDTHAH